MKGSHIIAAGIAGTTAFTLFSYFLSKQFKKDYVEPKLLGDMLDDIAPDATFRQSQFSGWVLHYLTGYLLAGGYAMLIDTTRIKPTLKNGIITGTLTGVPAVATWDIALKLDPSPPRKRSVGYYAQLVAGHTIFGAFAFLTFGCLRKLNEKTH
ncbi:MAG: hypothetical protein QM802_20870 [Agriterribacter sp.]